MNLPTPHYDKLSALLENDKLPSSEKDRVSKTIQYYNKWISNISKIDNQSNSLIKDLVAELNDYKFYIDYKLIFSSSDNFLYRQKGQLKLDNTVIEEFLPHLVSKVFPELNNDIVFGPRKCFSAMHFKSNLNIQKDGGGINIRTKDQDFAIAKKIFIRASHNSDFNNYETKDAYLGYVTAECKTNLDKTMFQEANATANDVKSAIPGSKYFLLCEWLDMTPVSTASTDIDEVLILRKAKRLSSNIRKNFSNSKGRIEKSDVFKKFLNENPFDYKVFERFTNHIKTMLDDKAPEENFVLSDGYF